MHFPGVRYRIDCRETGGSCSLVISGTYDDVLEEGTAHLKRRHAAGADDAEVEDAIRPLIRQERIDWLWPQANDEPIEPLAAPDQDWPQT